MIVWLNGAFVSDSAGLDTADRGFLLGEGAFETAYAEGGKIAFLSAHLERLAQGLRALSIDCPLDEGELKEAARRLFELNRLEGPAVFRLTISKGPAGRGLIAREDAHVRPTVLATLSPQNAPPRAMRLHRAKQTRFSRSSAARFKAIGGYLDNMAARREAVAAGADEALMLNEKARIACAAAANLFLIDASGRVSTPAVAEGAMPGVVRGQLLSGDHGFAIAERAVAPQEPDHSLTFLTNSLIGLVPATPPPSPVAGEVFASLKSWYEARLAREILREPQS